MDEKRETGNFGSLASERAILKQWWTEGNFPETEIPQIVGVETVDQPDDVQAKLGLFRDPKIARKSMTADIDLIEGMLTRFQKLPSFIEAGPRKKLLRDFSAKKAAVVTTGGVAPGLHCVIHSIVKRHYNTYGLSSSHGAVLGVYDSFRGLSENLNKNLTDPLNPSKTEEWLDQGGSKLGNVRYFPRKPLDTESPDDVRREMAKTIAKNLRANEIDILYVIGGDGSLKTAHFIYEADKGLSVVGIPKTMDNDIVWVWQSFGFNTAVQEATQHINTLRYEAEATRRICLIELFGAESGFVAANAALASGHVDLVLIPEVFSALTENSASEYLEAVVTHLGKCVKKHRHEPHAVVVVAEGVGAALENNNVSINGTRITKDGFIDFFEKLIKGKVRNAADQEMVVFKNQPRHNIRSVPANSFDQIYCERLGALAVDNALAGYTDFMVSQWLTEFVLVPLHLVMDRKKSIPVKGMLWKQVVSDTGQPQSAAE